MLSYILDQSWWNKRCYFPTAKQNGVIATFIRYGSINSSTGVCYSDYIVDENVSDALQYDVPFGAYFYMRPKFDGGMQGKFFVDLLMKHPPKLPAVIDVEEVGDYQNIIRMSQVLRTAGYKDMIYTRESVWDYNFPADPYWSTIDLWAARWSSGLTSPWSDGKFRFRDWSTWKFWQFSADGNARATEFGFPGYPDGDNDIDLSYYNGTIEDFETEYNVDNVVYPSNAYQVTTSGLYIRENPYIGAKILGQRTTGDIVLAEEYGGHEFWIKDERGWSAVQIDNTKYMIKL